MPARSPPRLHRPNLLWISVDTLRADHLRCCGYFRETSKRQRLSGLENVYALSVGPWKYVASPDGTGVLYLLEEDPYELKDVAEQHPDVTRGMADELERMRETQELRGALLEAGVEGELDEETLRRLKELGYIDEKWAGRRSRRRPDWPRESPPEPPAYLGRAGRAVPRCTW